MITQHPVLVGLWIGYARRSDREHPKTRPTPSYYDCVSIKVCVPRESADIHERVIDRHDKHVAGIAELLRVHISGDMRFRAGGTCTLRIRTIIQLQQWVQLIFLVISVLSLLTYCSLLERLTECSWHPNYQALAGQNLGQIDLVPRRAFHEFDIGKAVADAHGEACRRVKMRDRRSRRQCQTAAR